MYGSVAGMLKILIVSLWIAFANFNFDDYVVNNLKQMKTKFDNSIVSKLF